MARRGAAAAVAPAGREGTRLPAGARRGWLAHGAWVMVVVRGRARVPSHLRRGELGQHFLAGGRLAAELVEQAGVGPADLVVEIGAGTGVLTPATRGRSAGASGTSLEFPLDARAADLDARQWAGILAFLP
jgi:hypothetical protein